MDIYFLLNEVVFAAIEGIVVLLFFSLITGQKQYIITQKVSSIFFLTFFAFFSYFNAIYMPPFIHTLCYFIFTPCLLSIVTHIKIKNSITIFAILVLFLLATEIVTLSIAMLIMQKDIQHIVGNLSLKLQVNIGVRILQFAALYILFRVIKRPLFKVNILSRENALLSTTVLHLFVTGTMLVGVNYVNFVKKQSYTL